MDSNKWDKLYSIKTEAFSGNKKIINTILKYVKPKGAILDLGAGQGLISIRLAKLGFNKVVGVDSSIVGLNQLKEFAQKEEVNVEIEHSDILKYEFKENFNLIIASFSLQYLNSFEEISEIIFKMKKHTIIGGYNYISLPSKTQIAIEFPYLLEDKNQLLEVYRDWEILLLEENLGPYSNDKEGTSIVIIAKRIR